MKAKKSISDDVRKAIELRAYYIWESEGYPDGKQQEHWARAEAEVLGEPAAKQAEAPKKPAKKQPAPTADAETASEVAPAKTPAKAKAPAKKSGDGTAKTVIAASKTKKAAKPKTSKPAPREH